MCVRTQIDRQIHTRACMYTNTNSHVWTHTQTYTCTHTHVRNTHTSVVPVYLFFFEKYSCFPVSVTNTIFCIPLILKYYSIIWNLLDKILSIYNSFTLILRDTTKYRIAQLFGGGTYWKFDSHFPMFYLPILSLPLIYYRGAYFYNFVLEVSDCC